MGPKTRKSSTSREISCNSENCKTKVENNEFILCSLCTEKYHRDCLGMEKKFFDTLKSKRYSGVTWKCNKCETMSSEQSFDFADMIDKIRNELKLQITEQIKLEMQSVTTILKENFNQTNKTINSISNTEVNSVHNQKQQIRHTICLKPKDNKDNENFSKESWSEIVKNDIQPKLKCIPVTKNVQSKDGKGILFFPDASSRDLAAKELGDIYQVETQDRTKDTFLPKMKIGWIPKSSFSDLNKELLKETITEKNPSISDLVKNKNKVLDIVFISDEKDKGFWYAIIKVDVEVKSALEKLGNKLYIGMSACPVHDQYHLKQCYRCQRFGHKTKSDRCPLNDSDKEVCSFCSSNHRSKNCPVKSDSKMFKCNNCFSSENPLIRSKCSGHTTTNKDCPILQQALKATISTISGAVYKSSIPKNWITT